MRTDIEEILLQRILNESFNATVLQMNRQSVVYVDVYILITHIHGDK